MGQCNYVCGYVGVPAQMIVGLCGSACLRLVVGCVSLRGSSDSTHKGRKRGTRSREGGTC